jgi:predicted dehydrogenase
VTGGARGTSRLTATIVGTGGIACSHARACRDVDGVELVGACDVSCEAVDRVGDEWGCRRSVASPTQWQ